MLRKKLILTSYLVLAISLIACASGDVTDNTTPKEDVQKDDNIKDNEINDDKIIVDSTDSSNTGTVEKYEQISVTADDAYNTFLEQYPNAKVNKVALDYDDNRYYYKLEGSDDEKEYEMEVDAQSREVLKVKQDDRDDDYMKELTLEDIYKIDDIVKKVIEQEKSGFDSIEWELEVEDEKHVLEIEVEKDNNDVEYIYDLYTGELLEKDS